jgi:hypothetical protein
MHLVRRAKVFSYDRLDLEALRIEGERAIETA